MLPTPAGDYAASEGAHSRSIPISYDKLINIAKRVGIAQVEKAKVKKPEKATVMVSNSAVKILGKKHDAGADPLLHASISTIICTLVSKRSGIAVVVAHTWDASGKRGIGCDVLQLKLKGCGTFKAAVQAAVIALNAEAAAAASGPPPPPYTEIDPNSRRARRRSSRASRGSLSWDTPPARRRLRSIDADNDDGVGGYMSVPAFMPSEYRHEAFDEPLYDSIPEDDHAYMDICGPAMQGHYLAVDPANMSMDVASRGGSNESLYGSPMVF